MQKISNMYLTANTNLVTYPVVKIEVEGVQRKTMIDTRVGTSYGSSKLINRLNEKLIHKENKCIETLMRSLPAFICLKLTIKTLG